MLIWYLENVRYKLGYVLGYKKTLFVGYQFTKNRLKTLLLIIGESGMLGLTEETSLRFCKNLCETKVQSFVSSSNMKRLVLVRLMLHAYLWMPPWQRKFDNIGFTFLSFTLSSQGATIH